MIYDRHEEYRMRDRCTFRDNSTRFDWYIFDLVNYHTRYSLFRDFQPRSVVRLNLVLATVLERIRCSNEWFNASFNLTVAEKLVWLFISIVKLSKLLWLKRLPFVKFSANFFLSIFSFRSKTICFCIEINTKITSYWNKSVTFSLCLAINSWKK